MPNFSTNRRRYFLRLFVFILFAISAYGDSTVGVVPVSILAQNENNPAKLAVKARQIDEINAASDYLGVEHYRPLLMSTQFRPARSILPLTESNRSSSPTSSAPWVDDFGSGIGAPNLGSVAVGGSTNGNIETGGDRDWFAVTLAVNQSYIIRVNAAVGSPLDPSFGLLDSNGIGVGGNDDFAPPQR